MTIWLNSLYNNVVLVAKFSSTMTSYLKKLLVMIAGTAIEITQVIKVHSTGNSAQQVQRAFQLVLLSTKHGFFSMLPWIHVAWSNSPLKSLLWNLLLQDYKMQN
jgi:hypothetical protein